MSGCGQVRSLESYINIEILDYSKELIEGALFHRCTPHPLLLLPLEFY